MGLGYKSPESRVKNSKLSGDSEIYGSSVIFESLLVDSPMVSDESCVKESVLNNWARVGGKAIVSNSYVGGVGNVGGRSTLHNSYLIDGASVLDTADVYGSWLSGKARVSGDACVINADLQDSSHVLGDAIVKGDWGDRLVLNRFMFLHTGYWTRPPIYMEAELSKMFVQECANGNIHINCICNTPKRWLSKSARAGQRYGNMVGLNREQIEEILHLTESLCKILGYDY